MRILFLFFTAVLFSGYSMAQSPSEPYARDWKKADSLLSRELPESAEKLITSIYTKAKAAGQDVQMLKAQMYLLRIMQAKDGGDTAMIAKAVEEAGSSPFPRNAIWHSIAAELYWGYYQQHRWQILQRTVLAGTTPASLAEWDGPQFFRVIGNHYEQSLADAAKLQRTDISAYDPVLDKGVNTRELRPSLYDLLAFRALQFFENDEKEIAQPASRFEVDDPALFAPATGYSQLTIATRDTSSLQLEALRIYQRILATHLADARPDALIDADLHRLRFVYQSAVLPDKKERYAAALKRIAEQYPLNATAAEASFRLLELQYKGANEENENNERNEGNENNEGNEENAGNEGNRVRRNAVAIRIALTALAAKFPNSEAGANARTLLLSIDYRSLTAQAEETVLPGENSKILVTYKNIPQVFIRVIKIDPAAFRRQQREERETFYKSLLAAKPVQDFVTALPGTEDLESHSTEVKIDALPFGAYAVVLSAKSDFSTKDNDLSYALFQSTSIAVIKTEGSKKGTPAGFVLNRKTGETQPYVSIAFYREVYNNKTQRYDYVATPEVTTGDDGAFRMPSGKESYNGYSARSGEDRYFSNEYFYQRNDYDEKPAAQTRTYFFADRSIYRPGQTIYFKGITVRQAADRRSADVVPGQKTTVTFYDVNRQKIVSLDLLSNEYGSFSGQFVTPQGVLTGQMQIGNENGSAYISVEEYKRPKFLVEFDTVRDGYALNERVTVKGFAKAYAGNNIDGASVQYRVVREVRWPFWYSWWRPQPSSASQEIGKGAAETDAAGVFTISFLLQPDRSIDSATLPIFTYTVYADVTDGAGETRSSTISLSAGYRSIELDAVIPEKGGRNDLDTLRIRTTNLAGTFVAAKIQVSIHPLEQPAVVPRARLWPKPDKYLMTRAQCERAFPLDEYADESNPQSWKEDGATFTKSFTSTAGGLVPVPASAFPRNGWYVVRIDTKDKAGRPVSQKKYLQVWDAASGGRLATPLAAFGNKSVFEPGESLEQHLITGFEKGNILQVLSEVSRNDKLSEFVLTDAGRETLRTITETDRGGIAFHWLMVKDNRVYEASESIAVPWSNKDLQVSWETHRDKLQPGAKESWTMKVKGSKAESIAAEMVAGLYDASLDAFKPHDWSLYRYWAAVNVGLSLRAGNGFGTVSASTIADYNTPVIEGWDKEYDAVIGFGISGRPIYQWESRRRRGEEVLKKLEAGNTDFEPGAPVTAAGSPNGINPGIRANLMVAAYNKSTATDSSNPRHMILPEPVGPESPKAVPLRKNLQETAFFFPQLKTDAEGSVKIEFTMPEALTEWKFMALAHTKDLKVGTLIGSVKTQKDLMVQPGLPRFFRQGDEMIIATKIANLTSAALSGTAHLDIVDPATGNNINAQFGLKGPGVSFVASKDGSTSASWKIRIPQSRYEPVAVRITASAGAFTDGEENTLPVLSNRTLVTESLPLWMNGAGTKTFSFPQLRNADSSKTASPYSLTLEYTSNPAWYAVQALPYLMEYPYECAEQTFNRYYANALAAHILDKAPRIKEIFRKWETQDTAALLSNLEKNEELRSALLEETPWVLEAKNERAQKHRIGQLFNTYKLQQSLSKNLRKLQEMQLEEGGFPWFKGMHSDRYITQYIVAGIGRLQKLGVGDKTGIAADILQKAIPYLDREIARDYQALIKSKTKMEDQHIGQSEMMYLYARSFSRTPLPQESARAYNYYKGQAQKYWPAFNPYLKSLIALSLHRGADAATPKTILQSLRETSSSSEELGRWWKSLGNSWWWYEAPIEAQSTIVEAFAEVGKDDATVGELKRWMLKQKQTENWHSTRATADACYALLLQGDDWLSSTPEVTIKLGDKTIRSKEVQEQAGTGYFKIRYSGAEIKPDMGDITLTSAAGPEPKDPLRDDKRGAMNSSWGAVYYQYFEDFDKIRAASTPLSIKRQLFLERNGDRGPELQEITAANSLKVGDKVTIRIVLKTDRDMEYVHLKDARAAAFEPLDVLSGYRWQDGLGYYQSTRDASSNFFIDYLSKGTYVFTYSVRVTAKGNVSAGIATAQCMYAPEFGAHSEGARVEVR